MLAKLRPRSIYDVMALIAMVAALGTGSAYAADTVFSSDIKDLEVKNQDLAFDAVSSSKVKPNGIESSDILDFTITGNDFNVNTIGSSKIIDNSLTGNDVLETSLNASQFGKVPDADKLDGKDSTEFVGPAGKDGQSFTWRGAWDAESRYAAQDAVSYEGSSYMAKVEAPQCVPGECEDWDLMAAKGDQGPPGLSGLHYKRSADFVAQPFGGETNPYVYCDAGELATGGGIEANAISMEVVQTFPLLDLTTEKPTGWTSTIRNNGTDAGTANTWVLCAKVSP